LGGEGELLVEALVFEVADGLEAALAIATRIIKRLVTLLTGAAKERKRSEP
jgi:hypothetical protein